MQGAEQQAAEYKQRLSELAQRQAAAQLRMVEKEQLEVAAARERIQSLKKDNSRHLERMRKDLSNCRHPLYAYGDRFAMVGVDRVSLGCLLVCCFNCRHALYASGHCFHGKLLRNITQTPSSKL